MTIRDIVARIRGDLVQVSADSVFTDRHLFNAFWTASRLILQRHADDGIPINGKSFKSMVLNTEEVNKFDGTCVPLQCAVCRAKIGKPLMGKKRGFIYHFVGSVDYSTSFSVVTPYEFPIKTAIKGAGNFAYIDGEYIYFSKCLPCVRVVALFEEYGGDSDTGGCSVMDNEIALEDFLIEGAVRMAKENLIRAPYDHSANKNTNQ